MKRFVFISIFFLLINVQPSFAEKIINENAFSASESFDISHLIFKDLSSNTCIPTDEKVELCLQSDEIEDFYSKKLVEIAQESPAQSDKSNLLQPNANHQALLVENNNKPTFPLGLSFDSGEAAMIAINKSLNLFSSRIKESFSVWLERSARYVEIMKDVLKEKNVPTELVFLPLIESGFNLNAYSKAHAVGPWQFIESTGKRYGLIIDWWRDERKDPVKSTKAAANYLKDLYRMFGSWELALAAYNAGEGRISRALKKTYSDDYWDLLRTNQIRDETKNYVPHYIAATMIAIKPEDFGFHRLDYHEPLEYDEITIHAPVDIEVIAQCANTTVNEIRRLNAELRRWSTPPHVRGYTIKLPVASKEDFALNLSKIPDRDRFSFDAYKVKKGENIRTVAKKLNIPAIAIIELNSFTGLENLKAGDVIKIPPKDKFSADIHDKMSAKKVSAKKTINKNSTAKKTPNKKSTAKDNKHRAKTKKA